MRTLANRPGKGLEILLLAVSGACLRPYFSSFAAVSRTMVEAQILSTIEVAVLVVIPILAMGVGGLAALVVGRSTSLLLGCLTAVLAFASFARGFASLEGLYAAGVIAGLVIGMANVLVPSYVRLAEARDHAILMGVYTSSLCAGASFGAQLTPLIMMQTGSWSTALGMMAVIPGAGTLFWFAIHSQNTTCLKILKVEDVSPTRIFGPLICFTGLQGILAYLVFSDLHPTLEARGLTVDLAGSLSGLSMLCQIPGALLIPIVSAKTTDWRRPVAATAIVAGGTLIAVPYVNNAILLPILILQGFAQGGLIGLALFLIASASGDERCRFMLSSIAQGLGYILAGGGVAIVLFVRITISEGHWSQILIGGVTAALILSGWFASARTPLRSEL